MLIYINRTYNNNTCLLDSAFVVIDDKIFKDIYASSPVQHLALQSIEEMT